MFANPVSFMDIDIQIYIPSLDSDVEGELVVLRKLVGLFTQFSLVSSVQRAQSANV